MRRPLGNILWELAVLRLHLASICVCDGDRIVLDPLLVVAFRLIEKNRPFEKGAPRSVLPGSVNLTRLGRWTIAFDVAEDDRTLRDVFLDLWSATRRASEPASQPAPRYLGTLGTALRVRNTPCHPATLPPTCLRILHHKLAEHQAYYRKGLASSKWKLSHIMRRGAAQI